MVSKYSVLFMNNMSLNCSKCEVCKHFANKNVYVLCKSYSAKSDPQHHV